MGGGGGGGGGVRAMLDQKLGIEEQFAQMVIGTGVMPKPDDGLGMISSPPTVPAAAPVTGVHVGSAAFAPPGDYSNRVYSDDERSDHGVPLGLRKLPLAQQQPQPPQSQPKPSGVLDLPSPDSVSRYRLLCSVINTEVASVCVLYPILYNGFVEIWGTPQVDDLERLMYMNSHVVFGCNFRQVVVAKP